MKRLDFPVVKKPDEKPSKSSGRHSLDKKADEVGKFITNSTDDSLNEILRQFDLDMNYGPCLGLTRLHRWERAKRLNLNPPLVVKQILESPQARRRIPSLNENLWAHELL